MAGQITLDLTDDQLELLEQILDYEIELAEQDDNAGRLAVLRPMAEQVKSR